MTRQLPFQNPDADVQNFQFFEDMATAYWYSEAFFTALDLNLFDLIEAGHNSLNLLAQASCCKKFELDRFLQVLYKIKLICKIDNKWQNSQAAKKYLVCTSPDYMGDFFLYRRYMQSQWQGLTKKILCDNQPDKPFLSKKDDYLIRNFYYVQCLDRLAKQKAREIVDIINKIKWTGPVLDIGGGAGSLTRKLVKTRALAQGILFDIYEVISAARKIYPNPKDWDQVQPVAGDFRFNPFASKKFGLIIMSNFLHTYNAENACILLRQAINLMKDNGLIIIHDYFPDRNGSCPDKGVFYDLNMMLNTFDGQCHNSKTIVEWIKNAGIKKNVIWDLKTDSSIIIAGSSFLK